MKFCHGSSRLVLAVRLTKLQRESLNGEMTCHRNKLHFALIYNIDWVIIIHYYPPTHSPSTTLAKVTH